MGDNNPISSDVIGYRPVLFILLLLAHDLDLEMCWQHKMWAAPDRINQTLYGAEATRVIADELAREFDMSFHLPKLGEQKPSRTL